MERIWPFRFSRRADAAAVPMDRDFAPLFNFLAQPPRVFEEPPPALPVVAPAPVAKPAPAAPVAKKPAAAPAKAPAAVAASGLLRQLRSARSALSRARRQIARAALTPREKAADSERVRVWMDLDELAINVVRADGRPATAADAAEWLLRLNFLFDGEAWLGDRDDLRLLGGVGVRKVRKGE